MVVDKKYRIYPYQNGLLLGTEVDIVLASENSEPVDASTLFKSNRTYSTEHFAGYEDTDEGDNEFQVSNGMVKLYTRYSYCRAFSVDNIWWTMKNLVVELKKRAFLSSVPCFLAEDFNPPREDGMGYVAGGSICAIARVDETYGDETSEKLLRMTGNQKSDAHKRNLDNIRLLVGILSTILDRRESAEYRRRQFAPGETGEFKIYTDTLKYHTPSNFWIFSPVLAHLMLGLMRMAYFVTLNKIEPEIWEGFEPGDVHNAIRRSDYAVAEEIWHMVKNRLADCGYRASENPLWQHCAMIVDFLSEKRFDAIGAGIYKNWHMATKRDNYEGHFATLPSWEEGIFKVLSTESHPRYKEFAQYKDNYVRREKERTST